MDKKIVIDPETGELRMKNGYHNESGLEMCSSIPVAPPVGLTKRPSIIDQVRRMVRQEFSQAAREQGMESFEEADDFDVGDDFDPRSPYEEFFDPPPATPSEAPANINGAPPSDGPGTPASQTATPAPAAPATPARVAEPPGSARTAEPR